MKSSKKEENVISQLALLEAMSLAAQEKSTEGDRSRRRELAQWLTRLNSPLEVATMAVVAAEHVQEALRCLDAIGDGYEAFVHGSEERSLMLSKELSLFTAKKIVDAKKQARRDLARRAAAVRLERSPKQAEKSCAHALWKDWQAGKLSFRSGAGFARYVMDKVPGLRNQKVIEGWVTGWRRAAQLNRQRAS